MHFSSDVTVSNSVFNTNESTRGGAVDLTSYAGMTVSDSSFVANDGLWGGAFYLEGESDLILGQSVVSDNIGSIHGAGLYLETSTCQVSETTFSGNTDDEDTWVEDAEQSYTWGETTDFSCDEEGCE